MVDRPKGNGIHRIETPQINMISVLATPNTEQRLFESGMSDLMQLRFLFWCLLFKWQPTPVFLPRRSHG